MSDRLLNIVEPSAVADLARDPVDGETFRQARAIVEQVRDGGEKALRKYAQKFGDVDPGAPLLLGHDDLTRALDGIDEGTKALLERTAQRIRTFTSAQLDSFSTLEAQVPGGCAGHVIAPMQRAGCYAPGGRFPLPSSVLMTAITARVAGVSEVWVASPRPAEVTLAAAAVAGADGLLAVGGAQAIAALAYGAGELPACDVVVGPGNRWVTAAKHIVSATTGIDMLAGPSELVVLADDTADAELVAADLLAQAEHDPDARPILVTTSRPLVDRVETALVEQLADLPTAETARAALARGGFAVVAVDIGEAIALCDRIAPEHLEVMTEKNRDVARRCSHWGGLFIGAEAAEVLGDYGAGPNHTLPTGGTARHSGGLSVLDFCRLRTWMTIDDPSSARELVEDAADFAEIEGLAAHARAARRRLS